MTTRRVLFYVQHLLGIGHLARASRVSKALARDGFDVTMVTGGMPVQVFPGPGMRHVALPPVSAESETSFTLVDSDGNRVDDAFRNRRRDLLIATLDSVKPDIVIIEQFPFGRRKMRFELLPLLDAIARLDPKPKLVSSVRDILQEVGRLDRDQETVDHLNRHFDLLMVHGDESFARLADTFPLAGAITAPVAYTGIVASDPAKPGKDRFQVVVSAGGGATGGNLVRAALEAASLVPGSMDWAVITGPNLATADYEAAVRDAPPRVRVSRFRDDFGSVLAGAELSVSLAGYNTVGDVMRAGCRAILVPFTSGGETEQSTRAERLAGMGLATVVHQDALDGRRLAAAIETALAGPRPPLAALDLDGAAGAARLLRILF